MKTYKFVCARHEEYGDRGWKPLFLPNADPLDGMAVAHDILEHSRPRRSQAMLKRLTPQQILIEEFEAFGAALYIRHQGGYWHAQNRIHPDWSQQTHFEIFMFIRDLLDEEDWLPAAQKQIKPKTRHKKLTKEIRHSEASTSQDISECSIGERFSPMEQRLDDDIEEEIAACLKLVCKVIDEELGKISLRDRFRQRFTVAHQEALAAAVRHGFLTCKKRFKTSPEELNQLFMEIETKAGLALAHAYEGQNMSIKLDDESLLYKIMLKE